MKIWKTLKSGSKSQPTKSNSKALIIDDDPIVSQILGEHLKIHFPSVDVSVVHTPLAVPGFNIYFVDNDFGGFDMAELLVESIREHSPDALIIALSRTLDINLLGRLVNKGCNAVYNKMDMDQSTEARMVISKYVDMLKEREIQKVSLNSVFSHQLKSLRLLLKEWNAQLNHQLIETSR